MADGGVLAVPDRRSVVEDMSRRYGMMPAAFEQTLRATVVPESCSKEQFAAFLLVAKNYELNPLIKEIYAFPSKGGIVPIVSIDGWMSLMNRHPQMDGLEFEDHLDEGKLHSITARIWRKDRSRPISVTEYMAECRRQTPTWAQWPARMLRHKAAIQAARYAFGFSGIYEEDEAERIIEAQTPKSSSQAKKDGDWERVAADIAAAKTRDELDSVAIEHAKLLAKWPKAWREQFDEAVEKRLEAIQEREWKQSQDVTLAVLDEMAEEAPSADRIPTEDDLFLRNQVDAIKQKIRVAGRTNLRDIQKGAVRFLAELDEKWPALKDELLQALATRTAELDHATATA